MGDSKLSLSGRPGLQELGLPSLPLGAFDALGRSALALVGAKGLNVFHMLEHSHVFLVACQTGPAWNTTTVLLPKLAIERRPAVH